MKKMTFVTAVTVLLALCFTTGFTCSKNAPQQAAAPPETVTAPVSAESSAQPATETK